MEPEVSLQYLQEPATGPKPEPIKSSPQPHILFLYAHYNIILPFILRSPKLPFPFSFSD